MSDIYISNIQNNKQDLLTARYNITIVDNVISSSSRTADTTALQCQVDINTSDISGLQTNKQDVLPAGDNIEICGNVISSTDGGSIAYFL